MPRKDLENYADLQARAAGARGKTYWRTLDELAGTPEFEDYLLREFPQAASEWNGGASRRDFLKLMAASLALAGIGNGCIEQDHEKIVPYVENPETIVAGKPLYFATTLEMRGFGTGVLVESHMGRPTKIEGNPDHPASLGRLDAFTQAQILGMYDPDRSQVVRNAGQISSQQRMRSALVTQLTRHRVGDGAGLRILTETVTSPTLIAQMERLRERFPQMQWHHWDPIYDDTAREGYQLAFGDDNANIHALYDFSRADVVLAFDADFLSPGAYPLPYARQFMIRRDLISTPQERAEAFPDIPEMNRLYVVETSPTTTGAKADHPLRLQPSRMVAMAFAVAERLGIQVEIPQGMPALDEGLQTWAAAAVADLQNYRLGTPGASLVITGVQAPPAVQALVHMMNERLGNVGQTVLYREPISPHREGHLESLRQLVADMQAGEVESLIMIGGNPVYTAPADLGFIGALDKVNFRLHLSQYFDETSWRCHWHVPQSHTLEHWGDLRAYEGTASLIQPLINPLYEGTQSPYELLALLLDEDDLPTYDLVRDYWRTQQTAGNFEDFWRRALHRGVVDESANGEPRTSGPGRTELTPSLTANVGAAVTESAQQFFRARAGSQYEVVLRPDPTIWDGRFANNGWLQELPKPLTKLTWDNAALISKATADELAVAQDDMIDVDFGGSHPLRVPVYLLPGQPDGVVTLHLGYGRTRVGQVGNGTGFNVYPLRTTTNPWYVPGVSVQPTGETYPLATTQKHFLLDTTLADRNIMVSGTLDEFREAREHGDPLPHFMEHAAHRDHPSLYPEWEYDGYKWGMVVNQTSCVGCNACVVACQSENNIPVVGKTEVARSREMHWLRIDTYFTGTEEQPETHFQPMACVHCEKAPCEVVCPVAATTHSPEGLNEMTYNRCVGTRYCSNNCPYKVRRFNFLEYTLPVQQHPVLQLLQNPDVTVRARGVMEKCTYCVQRINHYRIETEKETLAATEQERPPQPLSVETACQAACPTDAIVFGDLNAKLSAVGRLREHPLNYGVLADTGTQPRTTHLASMTNPNPTLATPVENHAPHA